MFILVVGQLKPLESHKYEKIMDTTSNPIRLKFSWPFHIINTLPNLKTYFMMYTLYFFKRICCHHCKNAVFSPKGCNWNMKYSTWSHPIKCIDHLTFSGINKQLDYFLFKTVLFKLDNVRLKETNTADAFFYTMKSIDHLTFSGINKQLDYFVLNSFVLIRQCKIKGNKHSWCYFKKKCIVALH